MITQRKTANAVAGKTARACDSCLRKRARWYCAAEDAFLCQSCDASVHSANRLASRHERVRLETASFKLVGSGENSPEQAWHQGFARKARTPRPYPNKPTTKDEDKVLNSNKVQNSIRLVPAIGGDEDEEDEEEQQLLYCVPVYDHFAAELCNASNERAKNGNQTYLVENGENYEASGLDNFHGFLPTDDMEFLEFAADVESLLGTGLDQGIEGLGLIDSKQEEDNIGICFEGSNNKVKVEDEEVELGILGCDHMDPGGLYMTRETLDWDFGYESLVAEDEQKVVIGGGDGEVMGSESKEGGKRSSILLRLNYEGVITAWEDKGSPWTTGTRPVFNPDDCWPDFMGICSGGNNRGYRGAGCSDGGREARVSRYREKRRTRLFSKKIRYEVRKLNAEKRPRMKGRFVKSASFAAPAASAFPPYLMQT